MQPSVCCNDETRSLDWFGRRPARPRGDIRRPGWPDHGVASSPCVRADPSGARGLAPNRGEGRRGLRSQHRVRTPCVEAHSRGGPANAATQSRALARRWRRRADTGWRGSARHAAEAEQPGGGAFRRVQGTAGLDRWLHKRGPAAGGAVPGLRWRFGRPRPASPYGIGLRGTRRSPVPGRDLAGGGRIARRRSGTAGTRAQGRIGPHQRHAGLGCPGARRPDRLPGATCNPRWLWVPCRPMHSRRRMPMPIRASTPSNPIRAKSPSRLHSVGC